MEYIGLNHPQQVYAKRNLLYCELEMLQVIKRYQLYKKLRKEELALKNLLRKKIGEVKHELKFLNHKLPHVNLERLGIGEKPKPKMSSARVAKRNKLDMQIAEVKQRLLALQNE